MNRSTQILLVSLVISIVILLLCLVIIGGRLGAGLLGLIAAIEIRQMIKVIMAGRGFTLHGLPLPPAFYFLPAPPSGKDGQIAAFGFSSLLFLGIAGFLVGYMLGAGPFFNMFSITGSKILHAVILGMIWALLFSIVVLVGESGSSVPRCIDPGVTFVMMLIFGLMAAGLASTHRLAVFSNGYSPGWSINVTDCRLVQDPGTGYLRLQFESENSRAIFSRGLGLPFYASFEYISIGLGACSELEQLEFGITFYRKGKKKTPTYYVPLSERSAKVSGSLASVVIPREMFPHPGQFGADLRFRTRTDSKPAVLELREIRFVMNGGPRKKSQGKESRVETP